MTKLVEPLNQTLQSKPHSAVYRMHRYFARRPHSVFAELIDHYSDKDDVILDPFCGGGVTLVEAVLRGRRAIGVDINPLATFVTRMELEHIDLDALQESHSRVIGEFRQLNDSLFRTRCRKCGADAVALWFEYSAIAGCANCGVRFSIASAKKQSVGNWLCSNCGHAQGFSPNANTVFVPIAVSYQCNQCAIKEIADASDADRQVSEQMENELVVAENEGLWVPNIAIPDGNMQRESALFKKGIRYFRQLFTSRHLLALGRLRQVILRQNSPLQDWLLFSFSSTLRYTNRMVTRNPDWRGDRPLEWAKPGYWLPSVHLEANVLEEFSRRCDAVWRGKRDYQSRQFCGQPACCNTPQELLERQGSGYHIATGSSTLIDAPDESVDVIITDPPYGSYVHYADLCNFWSVWLPEIQGLGDILNHVEEAVIARKTFPGAKTAMDYQRILEECFHECARVLKPDAYLVLTFHNREPRAWVALLLAALKAGFDLPNNAIMFQDGIQAYRHTAQSRRAGSVIGDFILSFRKPGGRCVNTPQDLSLEGQELEAELLNTIERILQDKGPLAPDALMAQIYIEYYPVLLRHARQALAKGDDAANELITQVDAIAMFDSHRRQLLEQHFNYREGKWWLKNSN